MLTNIRIRPRSISRYFFTNPLRSLWLTSNEAGALLATGILNSGVRTEADAALALLADYVGNKSIPLKTSAIVG
jgi:hypothetical protein